MRQVTRIQYKNSVSILIALMIHGLARFGQRSSFTCFQALQKLGAHTHAHARTHTLTHMHTERPSATRTSLQKLGAHTHAHASTHTLTDMHTQRSSAAKSLATNV